MVLDRENVPNDLSLSDFIQFAVFSAALICITALCRFFWFVVFYLRTVLSLGNGIVAS